LGYLTGIINKKIKEAHFFLIITDFQQVLEGVAAWESSVKPLRKPVDHLV
jgi:hypothetical protein